MQGAQLALDPRDARRLAAVYWDDRRDTRDTCSIAVSSDGGGTWTSRAFAGAGSGNPLPSGMTLCRNAVVAFGPDQTLYAGYEVARPSGFAQVELTSSTDRGATFTPPVLVDPGVAGGGDLDPTIAAGRRAGEVYVSFQRYTADAGHADVYVVASTDAGVTVSAPASVSPPEQNAAGSRASLAVGRGGALYVAWIDGSAVDLDAGGGIASIEVAASGDGGLSFGSPHTVAAVPGGCGPNDDCGNRYPAVAIVSPAAGRLVAAWNGAAYPDASRIAVARSADGGRRWTTATTLAPLAGTADRDQFAPDLAAAPDGRVDLAFLDRARDADVGLQDVEHAHSLDGGKTFSRPLVLDDVPSDTQRGDFASAVSVGSSNAAAAAAWVDGRRGNTGDPATDVVFAARPDSQAPTPPLVRGALVVRSGRAVAYRLSSSDAFTPAAALRFLCAFDGASLRPCARRFSLRLAPGRHTLRARAVDGAGNRSTLTRVAVRALPAISRPR